MTAAPRKRARSYRDVVPVLDEAIRVRRDALKLVLSVYGANAGPNGLHDLRVSLRRTAALGRLLHGFPSPRRGRKVRKLADHLRRQLSPARQLEVSLELVRVLTRKDAALFRLVAPPLSSGIGVSRHPGIADVLRVGEEVLTAMDVWREALQDWPQDRAADRKVSRAIRRRILTEAKKIVAFGVPNVKTLHPLRIACKKLRYELEILREIVPGVERIVKASRRVQETLGDANDWSCVVQDLTKVAGALGAADGKRVAGLIARARSLRRRTFLRGQEVAADFIPLVETLARLLPPAG